MANVVDGNIPSLWDPAAVGELKTLDHHNAHTVAESIWQIWSNFCFLRHMNCSPGQPGWSGLVRAQLNSEVPSLNSTALGYQFF